MTAPQYALVKLPDSTVIASDQKPVSSGRGLADASS